MKFPFYFLLLAPCLAWAQPSPIESWYGVYTYSASYGQTVGGSTVAADYQLTLSKGQPACRIETSGFQTFEVVHCVAKASGNEVVLHFKSYESGDTKNAYGVAVYKPNEPLLKLERTTRNGKAVVVTRWLAMDGLDGKKPKPGPHFKRQTQRR